MANIPSIMGLHLRYRLWIAELNNDINILRIFDDYLAELKAKKMEAEVKEGMDNFKKQFEQSRVEIDELRHEMHLLKMKLAADSREHKAISFKIYQSDNHSGLKKRYLAQRKRFDQLKKDFTQFEGKWLQ